MEDKTQKLYQTLYDKGLYTKTYEDFSAQFADEVKKEKLFNSLNQKGLYTKTYEDFNNQFFVKKKDFSLQDSLSPASGKEELPFLDASGKPLTPQQPLPSAEKPRETTWYGDLFRTLKSSSLKTAGAVLATPQMINRTLAGSIMRPLVKSMGGTDQDAEIALQNMAVTYPAGMGIQGLSEAQEPLNKRAQKIEEEMHQIEGNIWENLTKGEDGKKDIGAALELFGRGSVASVPLLALTAATAGQGAWATLGTIGAVSASQQYAENEGMPTEGGKLLNAWAYGGLEALGELASAYIFRGIGTAFQKGLIKNVKPDGAKDIAKGIAKAVGLEGSSEGITQIGQNITDIVTGKNPDAGVFDNVFDAVAIGGLGFGLLGGSAKPIASLMGRVIASDKEVKQVQDNLNQQKVLIDQIDQTDSDPVKNALKRSIKDLRVQADEVMDTNYELATKLSPEKQAQVAELYSVWNELQAKIDNNEVSEQEVPALENTINGIKDQIQGIKDELVTQLEEEAKAEKEAKVDAVKDGLKTELDKIGEQKDKALEKVKDVKEGEKVNKKELESIKKEFEDKADEAKEKSEGELAKIEEETTGDEGAEGGFPTGEIAQETVTEEAVTPSIAIGEKTTTTDAESRTLGIKTANAFTIPITKEGTDVGSATIENLTEGWRIKWIDVEGTRTDKTTRGAGREAMRLLNQEAQKEGKVLISDLADKNSADMVSAWNKLVESGEAEKLADGSWAFKRPTEAVSSKTEQTETDQSKDSTIPLVTDKKVEEVQPLKEIAKLSLSEGRTIEINPEKSTRKEDGHLYDVNWYEIKDEDGNVIGDISLSERDGFYNVDNVQVKNQRKGVGLDLYKTLAKTLDKPLYSDPSLSESATGLWEKLVKEGVAEKFEETILVDTEKTKKKFTRNRYRTIAPQESVQKPVEVTELKQAPIIEQAEAKEAIIAPITEDQGEVPPPPQKPVKEAENAPEEKQREKGYYKRLNESSVPSEDLKDEIKEKGLTYTVLNNNVTRANIDFVISELGLDGAWKATKDLNSALNGASRSGISERLVVHYDKLATEAEKEGNLEDEKIYREKALEIAEWKDEYGRDAGQFNQYSGSDESTALLSPKSNVVRVKKSITKQRNKKIQENKDDIREKRDAMREANKESVNDVISSKQYEDLKKRITELERKIAERDAEKPPRTTNEKIKTEKEFRAKRWKDFKEAGKKSMSASILGLNSEQIEALGDIIASYVKEGAYRTEDIVKRFQKEFFKNTGKVITDEDVMSLMPKQVGDKTMDEALSDNENKALSDKLVEKVKRLLEDPKTPKNDPAKQLINTLFTKIEEKDTKEKVKPPKKSDVDKIREAIENKQQYAQTWDEAKEKVVFMIESNEDLTEEQKSDQKKRLQSFFEEVIGKPFAEKQVEGAVKQKIRELEVDLDKVVKQHYTVQDATGRTLAEKLVDEIGLSGDVAEEFASVVQKQFDKIATERKKKILLRGITARAKALTNPKQAKLEWQKLVELTNLGAFSSAEFSDAYADIWGFPKLSEEQSREIERLAKVIQDREGFKKDEAVRDYLNYLANLPGIDYGEVMMGWWYASILSGQRTQFKNFSGNLINTIFEATIGTIYNVGKGDIKTAQAMWAGLLNAGSEAWTEARYTFATGYSPVRFNKIEAAQTLERWKLKGGWKNPINSAKYIGRFMSATDAFFYVGLREMRAHELAMREAKKINAEAVNPSTDDWTKATEILFGTTLRRAEAEQQAKDEGLKGVALKKRMFELMEKGRGEGIVTESNNFASRGTYNYRPEGGLGMVTMAIGRMAESGKTKILNPFTGKSYTITYGKFLVPFTRIIANVGNTALDYTPIGAARAFKGSISTGREERREYTSEDKSRLLIKATVGTSAALLLYFLSEPPDDDKEQPTVQITANGTGDYAKNLELKGTPNGWQQYSIKVGDTWYSYQYTPLFLILSPMGFWRDTQKYKKDKAASMKALDVFAGLLSVSMSSLSDITVLTTVSNLMAAISSGDIGEFQRFWKKMTTSTVKGLVYPKAIEQTKQMIDDYKDNPNTYSSSFAGKIIKNMPVLKNHFPTQFNQFGEPVTFDAVQMLERPTTIDPVAKYLGDNGAFIGVPSQKDQSLIIYDDKLDAERGLTDKEYMLFVQTSGREIKNRIMDELMPRTDLTPEEVVKEVSNIKSEVRKQTKAVLFGWNNTRKNYPLDWNKMVETSAVPVPASMVEVDIDDKKVRLDDKQLDEFNEKAINYYREYVIEYLRDAESIKTDKEDINEETGSSYFTGYIKKDWAEAKADAKVDMEEILNKK